MKKIIIIIAVLFSLQSKAQNIDTVYVRNTTMTGGDWSFLVGKTLINRADSITFKALRRIRTAIQAQNPGNFTTNLTIDSIPGVLMVEWYYVLLNSTFAEMRTRGDGILTTITGKTVLTPFINAVDVNIGNPFIRIRSIGKNYLIDN